MVYSILIGSTEFVPAAHYEEPLPMLVLDSVSIKCLVMMDSNCIESERHKALNQ